MTATEYKNVVKRWPKLYKILLLMFLVNSFCNVMIRVYITLKKGMKNYIKSMAVHSSMRATYIYMYCGSSSVLAIIKTDMYFNNFLPDIFCM